MHSKKNILITGINGFLGSNLAKAISAKFNIIGLEYSLENLFRVANCNYKIYSAKEGILDTIFKDQPIDIILHTATIYGRNKEPLEAILATNFMLPFSLFRLGIKYKVQAFINTDTVLDRNVSPYALSKAQIRDWLQMYSSDLKVVNMQLEHFYGTGGSMDNFISLLVVKMLANTPLIDLTSGEQKRDFLYFDDVVTAFTTVINKLDSINDNYSNIQVASGEAVSIKNMVEIIKKLTNSSSVLNFGALPYRPNELMKPNTNSKALRALGWEPHVHIEKGLAETIAYIKNKIKKT